MFCELRGGCFNDLLRFCDVSRAQRNRFECFTKVLQCFVSSEEHAFMLHLGFIMFCELRGAGFNILLWFCIACELREAYFNVLIRFRDVFYCFRGFRNFWGLPGFPGLPGSQALKNSKFNALLGFILLCKLRGAYFNVSRRFYNDNDLRAQRNPFYCFTKVL